MIPLTNDKLRDSYRRLSSEVLRRELTKVQVDYNELQSEISTINTELRVLHSLIENSKVNIEALKLMSSYSIFKIEE